MICQHCNTNEATAVRRPLCHKCYSELRKQGLLGNYPLLETPNFKTYLRAKYGKQIFTDLKQLQLDSNFTLQMMGNKYGFTREYARQIFGKYFGFPYGYSVDEKRYNKRMTTFKTSSSMAQTIAI